MDSRGLLFIPDISGFTRFVNETDIEHSRLIIQELLEILINSNEIGLEVSEIEGDAILFYKFGDPPELETLFRQVVKMFREFHQHLSVYDRSKFCQCLACNSAIRLTLKVITHYGEFSTYSIKSFNKLIGKDIIIAHQLLKNDIDQHEYWLVTEKLLQDHELPDFENWMKWSNSANSTESGRIPFYYTQLTKLRQDLPLVNLPAVGLSEKVKALSETRVYDKDIITVFHAAGDFRYRNQWQTGVKAVEEISHVLPRVGSKCRLILENGESIVYSSSFSFNDEKIEFTESDEDGKYARHFLLEKMNENQTRLTISLYIRKGLASQAYFNFAMKNKAKISLSSSMNRLQKVIETIDFSCSS
jgi:hypothetical protein